MKDLAWSQELEDRRLEKQQAAEVVKEVEYAVSRLEEVRPPTLEEIAHVVLPGWLKRHERVQIDQLERRLLEVDGESLEVNLCGKGRKGRRPITVVGEAKSRIHAGDVKEFADNLQKIRRAMKDQRILPLMFGYWIHPAATSLGKQLGIRLVASYQR